MIKKRFLQLFGMAMAFIALTTMSSCKDTTYSVAFGGNPVIDEIIEYSATVSELDNNKKELRFHDLGKVEVGYKSKKYTAHSDATSVRIDITFIVTNGDEKPENTTSQVFFLVDDHHNDVTVTLDFSNN